MARPFRSEHKFLIHHSTRTQFLERWGHRIIPDPTSTHNGVSPVLSLYYDTPDLTFYHDKLDGFGLRQKVRLRTYGHRFQPGQVTYLEIKQRSNDRIRKLRWRIADYDPSFLNPASWDLDVNDQTGPFGILLHRHRLRPTAQVWYQREAFISVCEPDLRITFDSCVTAMFPGEQLHHSLSTYHRRTILPDSHVILEFKYTHGLPSWLTTAAIVAELQERPIPKYILAVDSLRLLDLTPVGVYA